MGCKIQMVFRKKDNKNYVKYKLDGIGPVDNRPSTKKLHHFVQEKKKKKNCDMWHMTCDM